MFSLCMVTNHCFLHHVVSSLAPVVCLPLWHKVDWNWTHYWSCSKWFYCREQLLTLSCGTVHYSVNLFPSLLLIMHVMFTVHCEIHVYYKKLIILKLFPHSQVWDHITNKKILILIHFWTVLQKCFAIIIFHSKLSCYKHTLID